MERIAAWIDRVNERVGRGVAWLTLFLVLLVFTNVFLRYVLNYPLAWAKELEWHLFALIFLLGAGYGLLHDRHVRVDLFYERMRPADRGRVNFLGTLIFLLPWCVLLIYSGWNAAVAAWRMGERSGEAGGLPNLWLIQFALPLGVVLLLLQGVAILIRGGRPPKNRYK